MTPKPNVDSAEIARFDALANRWWDPQGEMAALHALNPVRLAWIEAHAELAGAEALDVGCGGGLLAEALAARGARVTGIDVSQKALEVARLHLVESGLAVSYDYASAEDYAERRPGAFDLVTCMELLEHVPDPKSTVSACAQLLRPGGRAFFATLNRNPKSYLLAIVGAEYLLGLLPRGTHDYARFIRPAELAACCRSAALRPEAIGGIAYDPLTSRFRLSHDCDVNYLLCATKDG